MFTVELKSVSGL